MEIHMNTAAQSMRQTTTASGHTSAIRAKKVIGTSVYNASGDKIGSIDDIVLDKLSNNIIFAVCSFGGFLGMGEQYHPLPWSTLKYDAAKDGYVVSFTREQLKAAPADSVAELMRGNGEEYRDRVYDYYRTPRYW
jgi:hypothetical protein